MEDQWEKAALRIKNADSITKNADSVSYSFSSHLSDSYSSEVGTGNIEFEVLNYDLLNGDDISTASSDKNITIKIKSSSGEEENVPCVIKPSDCFVPVGGAAEEKLKKMIVIKDGQTSSFTLKNLNQSSSKKGVEGVYFFPADTIAQGSSDFARSLKTNFGITSYDDECKKVSIKLIPESEDDDSEYWSSDEISVTVSHNTDYGVKWPDKGSGHPTPLLNLYKDSKSRLDAASSSASKISVIKDVMNTPRTGLASSTK